MEKNIIVVDEYGHNYGVTYPKRAKGLVKNGRARYVDEHTICLACPPDPDLGDIPMNETIRVNTSAAEEPCTGALDGVQYTIPYILKQLEQIAADTGYIHNALARLDSGSSGSLSVGLGNLIREREQTNRKLIDFYEKIYNDLHAAGRTKSQDYYDQYITRLLEAISACGDDEDVKIECLSKILEKTLKEALNN